MYSKLYSPCIQRSPFIYSLSMISKICLIAKKFWFSEKNLWLFSKQYTSIKIIHFYAHTILSYESKTERERGRDYLLHIWKQDNLYSSIIYKSDYHWYSRVQFWSSICRLWNMHLSINSKQQQKNSFFVPPWIQFSSSFYSYVKVSACANFFHTVW